MQSSFSVVHLKGKKYLYSRTSVSPALQTNRYLQENGKV
jgi:hypothetical protein